jgi:hypothetical protein
VRAVIDTMFGQADSWNGARDFQLFVHGYDPQAEARLCPRGHLDFVNCTVPILGSGFMFQVSLIDSEPFSGNITIYPGSHTSVQAALIEEPTREYPDDLDHLLAGEPYEFVAEAGDMLLFHHLVGHSGNPSHAAGQTPRVVLHCQACCHNWLDSIDPATAASPWELSLATNGAYTCVRDEKAARLADSRQKTD